MIKTDGKFYIGRIFDPKQGKAAGGPVFYDPADLTTHAAVVGMTGSGKTGLCIDLLEEAALQGIPAMMIDPKGDITNTLLHFPNLSPADFQPWLDADEIRRSGKTLEKAAAETATMWKNGLVEWGIDSERIRALQNAAHFAVYTPGSESGIPVSILASLQAPSIPWESNQEILREKIASTVTGILGLVGLQDVDPVRSRQHILLSNIFENAWSQGKDLELSELVLQTQNPPFTKLGVFDVNTFYPEKDRFELAMLLNNILASPAFQTWLKGQALDPANLLYAPDGRPRHSVFYIAHLGDTERMFFITLLLSAVETWMRTQSGTSSLRTLLYFDEIYEYMPPVKVPPSKPVLLRMLKQARAFGVGLLVATQNPADLDYKALSNTGTWFIGKLQTDPDKQRLLDGLEGASPGIERSVYDRLLSTLGKRVFLLHNVHEKQPQLFQTRWSMNYLAGPFTRTQIASLNQLVGAQAPAEAETPPKESTPTQSSATTASAATKAGLRKVAQAGATLGTATRPAPPIGVTEYVLPHNRPLAEGFKASGQAIPAEYKYQTLLYHPMLLAQARLRLMQPKYKLNTALVRTALVEPQRGSLDWAQAVAPTIDPEALTFQPDSEGRFVSLENPLTDSKAINTLRGDFQDWVLRTSEVVVSANESLALYAGPEVSPTDFLKQCSEAAQEKIQAEAKKVADSFDKRLMSLREKLSRQQRELQSDQSELDQRKVEEIGTHVENVLSLFGGRRRRVTTSLTKHRLTEQTKAEVDESVAAIADYQQQISHLEAEKNQALEDIKSKWGQTANQISKVPIVPAKKDIQIEVFGLAWAPYHVLLVEGKTFEIPAFELK